MADRTGARESVTAVRPAYRAAPLGAVRLLPGPVLDRQHLNTQYLLGLDPQRLLRNFRVQAGIACSAEPYGGWEAPDSGLRGHFVGHFLSACAQGYAAIGEVALRDRANAIVGGLEPCQQANGYLSAFPESDLDVIESRFEGAWAPYYVLHKLLAGLIDVHLFCASDDALRIARRLADYIVARLGRLTPQQIEGMCRTDLKPNPANEFGGIGESLQDLADLTGDARYDQASRLFDRDWFIGPLLNREDHLTGLHANTHIPMILSLARRYERSGDAKLRAAVEYFWELTAVARSFVNGGSSGPRPDGAEKSTGGEHWPAPFSLARTLTTRNNESCVTHNMLRLTDLLFSWSAEPRYADFYERAYFNHVLALQHPGHVGGYLYDHPLVAHSRKKFGGPDDSFWCCYGTTVEAFERLAQGIYYLAEDELRVNLFVASQFNWREKGVLLRQETHFPQEAVTKFSVKCDRPVEFTLTLRLPQWARDASVEVTGEAPRSVAGATVAIRRVWNDGDVATLSVPMRLYTETMPDDASMIAFRLGPLVLAARGDVDLRLPAQHAADAVAKMRALTQAGWFATTLANGQEAQLVPLNQIVDEPFGVYFQLARS